MFSSQDIIREYASNPLFQDAEAHEILIESSPFRRPTRVNDNAYINYDKPLTKNNLGSNSALSTHRMLLNIYESDMMLLPQAPQPLNPGQLDLFYGYNNILAGERARPVLEQKAFTFLRQEVSAQGNWNGDLVLRYFDEYLRDEAAHAQDTIEEVPLFTAILNADDPQRAARHYLIQMAPDFLSEASAMARYAPGAFGPVQSSLFNIIIDEYGASVHNQKHSTLFEQTMASVGLSPALHTYWQFYQASSLALTNYFHYLTRNKALFFRYVGALFYTESSLVNVTGRQSQLLREVFGEQVNTHYFDEHHHIDRHHGEMVLKRMVIPLLNEYGDAIARDILEGFEEFRLLQELADQDLYQQFIWAGNLTPAIEKARDIYERIEQGELDIPLETFIETNGERSTTHTHPDDRLLVIETGEMDFWPMYGQAMHFNPGDVLFVPKHRLHGSVVTSDQCLYHQPLVDGVEASPALAAVHTSEARRQSA